jgi:chromosome segregation ATPase
MAVTNEDLNRLRHELEMKVATVTVDQVNAATAISAYAERINGIELRVDALANEMDRRFDSQTEEMNRRFDGVSERFSGMNERLDRVNERFSGIDERFERLDRRMERMESKLDTRFGWQTFMMTALAVLILFGDAIRNVLGL